MQLSVAPVRANSAPRPLDTKTSYDAIADEYVRRIFDELQHKPLDRQLLDRFAENLRGLGPVCDVGCGPGHVARYLQARGVSVCGIDLSGEMVRRARELTDDIDFRQDDMLALHVPDEAWAGVVAFYSIIHIARDRVVQALSELRRVLQPGGMLLLGFHLGNETVHLDEWWEQKVSVDFFFFELTEMVGYLTAAGLEIGEVVERDPYPDVEHQNRRGYILARRPQ